MSGSSGKVVVTVKTDTDTFELNDYLAALSEFGHVEPSHAVPRERTIFNAPKKAHEKAHVYDALNPKHMETFNPKLRRDDRRHYGSIGLNICAEEDAKLVPSRVSSDIGHYLNRQCDPHDRSHVRIQFVENQFFRRNGVDFKKLTEDQNNKTLGH